MTELLLKLQENLQSWDVGNRYSVIVNILITPPFGCVKKATWIILEEIFKNPPPTPHTHTHKYWSLTYCRLLHFKPFHFLLSFPRFDLDENQGPGILVAQFDVINQEPGKRVSCSFVDDSNVGCKS